MPKQISVSDQNYRRLQALARPLEDSVDSLLGRLLDRVEEIGIQSHETVVFSGYRRASDLLTTHGRIPSGLQLQAKYKGTLFSAEIASGAVVFNGQPYPSLSSAAIAALHSAGSTRPTENGWRFWQYFDPGKNTWFSAEELKQSTVTEQLREIIETHADAEAL